MSTENEITTMKQMTLQQLEDRLEVVEVESASIKSKLDKVRADRHLTGQWADPDWYRRASTRARFLGVEHQQLTREIAKRKREERAATNANIERAFVGIAKERLSGFEFDQMLEAARAKVAGNG